ncbi:hypothetical protein BVRB_8g187220 [Beta vulgaris subsp. vulgaris]|nr:hypothetical protein BVRB_8g187220 [Beta vulgaris subsp. vulgaris]
MTVPRKFIYWVLLIFLFLGILAIVLWLDLRHQPPSFTIVNFSAPLSNGSPQRHNLYVTLNIENPSDVYSIIYDYAVLTVNYSQRTIGQTDLGISHQSKGKEISASCQVQADVQQWEGLAEVISKSSGEAMLKVEVKTGIRYHNMGHSSKQYNLTFQGQFKIGPDGKILGKKKKVKLCKGSCLKNVNEKKNTLY